MQWIHKIICGKLLLTFSVRILRPWDSLWGLCSTGSWWDSSVRGGKENLESQSCQAGKAGFKPEVEGHGVVGNGVTDPNWQRVGLD